MCIVSAATRTAPYVQLAVSRDRAGASGFCRLKNSPLYNRSLYLFGKLDQLYVYFACYHTSEVFQGSIFDFFFLFLSSANESCPMLAWRGKTLTRTPPAQTRRKAPVWPSAKRSCFSFSNCSLMCQKKEKKKRKERKKIGLCFTEGATLSFFFFFFWECRSGWSRSLRNWNGECWNSWKGTKTRAGRKEKEDPGEKKHEKGIRNEYVGCHVAASPDLKTKTSQAQRLMQPLNLLRLDDNKL